MVGADLLRRGYRRDWVDRLVIWKGLDSATVRKIAAAGMTPAAGQETADRMDSLDASIGMGGE